MDNLAAVAKRAPGAIRRVPAALAVVVGLVALSPAVPAAAISPIRPDNAPTQVAGQANGQLPAEMLRWVAPRCQAYVEAAASLAAMLAAAQADGIALGTSECYRDYAGQVAVRQYWCDRGHCEFAAVPGTSFHGWGKAVDLAVGGRDVTFDSPAMQWLRANAGRFGWNHPGWAEPGGGAPEAWHWEWVGDGGRLFPGMVYPTPTGSGVVLGGDPVGRLDGVESAGPNRLLATGWTIDPDHDGPVDVHLYLDGRFAGLAVADQPRADIGLAYPGYGPRHGWSLPVETVSGGHRICAYAVNRGVGSVNTNLGCRDVFLPGDPVGSIDDIRVATGPLGAVATVRGWAIDPDTVAPIEVHGYVDGIGAVVTANGRRPDLATAFPRYGSAHGFDWSFPVGHGSHSVCAFGINVGAGSHGSLGCRPVAVDRNPIGSLDTVTAAPTPTGARVSVTGWALDPDAVAPTAVHLYVDGVGAAVLRADGPRLDVGTFFADYGISHGFRADVAVGPGPHTVCAYGINIGDGDGNRLLGCRATNLPRDPIGSLDAVGATVDGRVAVHGWALDPDTVAPIEVHVYVDGVGAAVLVASSLRPDVAAAFPPYGAGRGFSAAIEVSAGWHTVCAYAVNRGSGTTNPRLGCRTVLR